VKITLNIWRQKNPNSKGFFEKHTVNNVSEDMSFLEMLDLLNNDLIKNNQDPVAFDHDCREGICGTCGVMINGRAHGPLKGVTTCQLHMRTFKDGDEITIEPWRAKSFPIIKDLVVNRISFDNIMESGGYVSVKTGGAPDANAIPILKDRSDEAFDSATCIGCGACVAACKNSSAMLFVSAKINQYANLPQGQVENYKRVRNMIGKMDEEDFGSCTNTGACEAECPKEISIDNIIKLNKEYIKTALDN
tara:strand:- start:1584 stop:2327 length:744 start_codon:yes stop_codon:yes gene_type:complete